MAQTTDTPKDLANFVPQPYPLYLTVEEDPSDPITWLIIGWERDHNGQVSPVLVPHHTETMAANEITNPMCYTTRPEGQVRISPTDPLANAPAEVKTPAPARIAA